MLVGFRNNILIGGLILSFFCLFFLLCGVYNLFTSGFSFNDVKMIKTNIWWFTYQDTGPQGAIYIWGIISIISLLLIIFISGWFLRNLFKKTASPELFFYIIFLFSFSFESFRLINIFINYYEIPVHFGMLNSRLIYFGRLFGLVSLLCSSLYALDIKYQKFGTLLGGAAFLSLIVAYTLPLDSSVFLTNFLYRPGDEQGLFLLNISFMVFIVMNFIIAAIKKERRYFLIMLAVILVLAGRELLFFAIHPGSIIPGLLLVVFGTGFFSRQIDKIYFWS